MEMCQQTFSFNFPLYPQKKKETWKLNVKMSFELQQMRCVAWRMNCSPCHSNKIWSGGEIHPSCCYLVKAHYFSLRPTWTAGSTDGSSGRHSRPPACLCVRLRARTCVCVNMFVWLCPCSCICPCVCVYVHKFFTSTQSPGSRSSLNPRCCSSLEL